MGLKGFKDHNEEHEQFVIKGRDIHYSPEPKGLGCAYFKQMKKNKHAIAQIDAMTGLEDTYESLLKRCIRTAMEMRIKGITSDDFVTICSFNQVNSCVPLVAAAFLGAKVSCLDPLLSLQETIPLVQQTRPKMAFVGLEAEQLIEDTFAGAEVEAEIVVFGPSTTHTEFLDFLTPKLDEEKFRPVEIKDLREAAIIFFSSGTTGLPKGISASHYGLLMQGYNLSYIGFTLDVVLMYASFYWISSVILFVGCTLTGSCRLVVARPNPDTFWKLLNQYKVTLTFMAPTQVITVGKKGRPEGIDTTHLAEVMIGGGPISGEYVTSIREIFPGAHIEIVYGQTEVIGLGLCFQPKIRQQVMLMYQKPGSTGMPVPGMMAKIVDSETEETLGPNQRGELRLKADFLMNGYYKVDSSGAWDSKGWLKTGDVAYYDDDECFFIVDRIKEMLKFQAYHVPPAAIEAVLLSHPSIAGAVVVGIPHDIDGDHPVAAVVLKNPNEAIQEEDIVKYVEERLDDKYRLRGGARIVKKLPLTATGKIRRCDTKKMILEEKT